MEKTIKIILATVIALSLSFLAYYTFSTLNDVINNDLKTMEIQNEY